MNQVSTLNGALDPGVEGGMLEPFLQPFLHQPVIVSTPLGQVVGVLVDADAARTIPRGIIGPAGAHGGVGSLLIHEFQGTWRLVKAWTHIKTARSST
jgi:hypothetical protein